MLELTKVLAHSLMREESRVRFPLGPESLIGQLKPQRRNESWGNRSVARCESNTVIQCVAPSKIAEDST